MIIDEGESASDEISQELTLNEQVVIGAIAAGFALFVIKQRMCPKSWEPHTRNKLSPSDKSTLKPIGEAMEDDSQEVDGVENNDGDKINTLAAELSRLDHFWPQKRTKFGDKDAEESFHLSHHAESRGDYNRQLSGMSGSSVLGSHQK